MTLCTALAGLKPGDKFIYKDHEYLLIDFQSSNHFNTAVLPVELFCALDLQTYKVVCFNKNWEVKLHNIT